MKIIATPIILENYVDGVIMRKDVFLNVCEQNSTEGRTPETCIENHLKRGTLLDVYGDYVIVDRKFYDNSKLIGQYRPF